MRLLLISLILSLLATPAIAQENACPAFQDRAIASVSSACAEQELNSICFGHPTVSLAWLPDVQAAAFSQPGDQTASNTVDWFSTSSEDKTWGTARILFAAYPPDGLEAQTAALLAFGDVALFLPPPASIPGLLLDIAVAATQGANLRAEPNTDAQVIRTVAQRTSLKAVNLNEDGTWIQAYADPEVVGWISRELVAGDIDQLQSAPRDSAGLPLWFPWQAFDFRSGINDAPCAGAADSGLLLQTNRFQPPRQFWLNGLDIRLNGAVFLQAQIDAGMSIYVLDGDATISVPEARVVVKSGFYTQVPLSLAEDGSPIHAQIPAAPSAYDYQRMLRLPIAALHYPTRIGLDPYSIIAKRPSAGQSPLEGMSAEAPCKITAGTFGANIRSHPDPEASIIAVMGHRESADPIARAIGADDLLWWKLADHVWIRIDATVNGGKCSAVPLIAFDN
ncbi:MAG: SH3 domain-containing protein [Chloroflexi bacterium]|nr:SH3 domain-containing protein [Chloroflexota bacterium]